MQSQPLFSSRTQTDAWTGWHTHVSTTNDEIYFPFPFCSPFDGVHLMWRCLAWFRCRFGRVLCVFSRFLSFTPHGRAHASHHRFFKTNNLYADHILFLFYLGANLFVARICSVGLSSSIFISFFCRLVLLPRFFCCCIIHTSVVLLGWWRFKSATYITVQNFCCDFNESIIIRNRPFVTQLLITST